MHADFAESVVTAVAAQNYHSSQFCNYLMFYMYLKKKDKLTLRVQILYRLWLIK